MSVITQKERVRADYSPSLQQAAKALWGDDFWGRHAPRPAEAPAPAPRGR